MKRFFTKLSVSALLLASAFPAIGAEPIFSFDFENETTFNTDFSVKDNNEDGTKWKWTKYNTGNRPYYYAQCYYWNATYYNDAMTTKNAYHLESGHAYLLSYEAWAEASDQSTTTLAIGYFSEGDEENPVRITSLKPIYINKYNGDNPPAYDAVFEVEETGDYYFTFMAIGDKGGTAIDNVVLTDAGSPMAPQSAASLNAEAATDFSLSATISFTLPTKTVTGNDLPANGISKAEIYRGTALIHTITSDLTLGQTISRTDNNAEAGNNIYKVIVYNGELASSAVETTVFVGPMTPLAPTSVLVVKAEGGKEKITWTAPTLSVEEQTLKPELITYNVYRKVNDSDAVKVASAISNTEFEDSYSPDEIAMVTYEVEALYSGLTSEKAVSNTIKVGTYTLPFEESFVGAVLPDDWEITTTDTSSWSTKKWIVASRMTSSPNANPFDGDGGFLTYNSYSASRGLQSQAITPEIKLNGAKSPVLEFQFYHSTNSSSNDDYVVIEVSKDGGAFEEMAIDSIKRYNATQGWKLYQIPLSAYKDAQTIRISFKAVSNYGADMAIDAIRIFNAKSNDLEAGAITAVNAEVNSGEDAEFKFTVKNVAFGDVSGEDYSVKAYLGDELLTVLPGQDVAATQSVEFTFSVSSHAGHIEAGIPVYAEIDYADDEDMSNNESAQITVSVKSYAGENATDLTGTIEGQTLRLNWTAVTGDQYEAVASEITLDREEDIITGEAYNDDNTLAWPSTLTASDGKIWKNIDKDGIELMSQYSMPAGKRGFMITSKGMSNNNSHLDFSGEEEHGMLVAAAPKHGKGSASDYLVSPLLPGRGNHTLSFEGKVYSGACTADFVVEYTTDSEFTTDDIEDKFVPAAPKVHYNVNQKIEETGKFASNWHTYSYKIPADAKYVAIHFVGTGGVTYEEDDYGWGEYYEVEIPSVFCIDNIKLTSAPMDAPTYNVYYREIGSTEDEPVAYAATTTTKPAQKHNSAPVETGEYVLALPAVATDYHVSAVYPAGETALSAPYSFNVPAGIENVDSASGLSIRVEGRSIRAFANGEEVAITVYDLDGKVVALNAYGFMAAQGGAYIVTAEGKATKIVVK